MAHARATRRPPLLLNHLLSGDATLMIVALSLQQCGKLPGNPLVDANSLLEFRDADALRGLVNNVYIAGTQDQRRRHAAVLGGFGPYPHDASLAADGSFHGAHQRRIGWKLGRRRFRPHLFATTSRTPCLVTSSSAVSTIFGRTRGSICRAAERRAAIGPFMSAAPSPVSRSRAIAARNGSVSQPVAETVSR